MDLAQYLFQIENLKAYLFTGLRREVSKVIRSQNRYRENIEKLTEIEKA